LPPIATGEIHGACEDCKIRLSTEAFATIEVDDALGEGISFTYPVSRMFPALETSLLGNIKRWHQALSTDGPVSNNIIYLRYAIITRSLFRLPTLYFLIVQP